MHKNAIKLENFGVRGHFNSKMGLKTDDLNRYERLGSLRTPPWSTPGKRGGVLSERNFSKTSSFPPPFPLPQTHHRNVGDEYVTEIAYFCPLILARARTPTAPGNDRPQITPNYKLHQITLNYHKFKLKLGVI